MLKKRTLIILTVLIATLLSCSEKKISLTTSEGLASIKKLATEQFGGDLEVYSLSFSSKEKLNDNLGDISVSYFKDDNESYSRVYKTEVLGEEKNLSDEKKYEQITKMRPRWMTPEANGKVKIKDINFESVIDNVNKAIELLGDDVGTVYVKDYSFSAEPKTNAITSSFKLEFTPSENATELQGKQIVTNYYEAEFDVDEKGNVTLDD